MKIKNSILAILVLFGILVSGAKTFAQTYDSVSGATQKEDGKVMTFAQLMKAFELKGNKYTISTVNADGTPNAAVFGRITVINENVIAVGSIADTKTTKINVKERDLAILLVMLQEKTEEGFDGAKVVLKYIEDEARITEYRQKLEKSSERTTFFEVVKLLHYH